MKNRADRYWDTFNAAICGYCTKHVKETSMSLAKSLAEAVHGSLERCQEQDYQEAKDEADFRSKYCE